jgi:hypothetical protein
LTSHLALAEARVNSKLAEATHFVSIFSNPASSTPAETARYVAALLDLLGNQDPVAVLRGTPAEIVALLDTVPDAVRGKPEAPGKWSIRDVVQHLADSELVGGFRLRLILAQVRPPLTPYDQDLWADRLEYHRVNLDDALQQFTILRRANLRVWERLGPAELIRVGVHGERGEESLEHLRKLYAAHDLLHLRQLGRIRAAVMPATS